MTGLGQPGDEVEREERRSTYTWYATDLNALNRFVLDLYSVGAIGDERVQPVGNRIEVAVASDDLLPPKPGESPIRIRYSEWRSLHARTTGLLVLLALLGVAVIVLAVMLVIRW